MMGYAPAAPSWRITAKRPRPHGSRRHRMADKSTPTPGEIVIMASGAVGLIFSFLHFYQSPSIVVAGRSVGGGGISAWSSGLFPVATLIPISLVVMAAVVALTRFANVSLP